MKTILKLSVEYDRDLPGVRYYIDACQISRKGENWQTDSGVWEGHGPQSGDWFSYVKRHMALPYDVEEAGLTWNDADVDVRPDGIEITWTWRE